ncbi:FAD dependent oxidoreductase [Chytriomyces sp. MP71]|nr:FAD dependent oxidoreductase [Chytriomyces sp. MP71]
MEVVLVEATGRVADCASGKAGGFLARDWPDSELSRSSYSLHTHLAKEHNGAQRWLYRTVETFSVAVKKSPPRSGRAAGKNTKKMRLDWVAGSPTADQIGTHANTAQVHPRLLCEALFELSGAKLVHARVCDLVKKKCPMGKEVVVGVSVVDSAIEEDENDKEGKTKVRDADAAREGKRKEVKRVIEADHIVVALGPWCDSVMRKSWGCRIRRVAGQKGHSVVFQAPPFSVKLEEGSDTNTKDSRDTSLTSIPGQCLFTEVGKMEGPEVYPRSDGTVYVCGGTGDSGTTWDELLPDDPTAVQPAADVTDRLVSLSATVSPLLGKDSVIARQACFLPATADGVPLIGRVDGFSNLLVGTGNSVWGILNGPATGRALAEMIVFGESRSLDLDEFDPNV